MLGALEEIIIFRFVVSINLLFYLLQTKVLEGAKWRVWNPFVELWNEHIGILYFAHLIELLVIVF